MKADIELTRFGRIMKTDLKRRRHMGGTWLLMLDVSACNFQLSHLLILYRKRDINTDTQQLISSLHYFC